MNQDSVFPAWKQSQIQVQPNFWPNITPGSKKIKKMSRDFKTDNTNQWFTSMSVKNSLAVATGNKIFD